MSSLRTSGKRTPRAGGSRPRARSAALGGDYARLVTKLPIGRNTGLLSASLATNSATLQLSAAVASLTLVRVLHIEGLLGLGPAIVLAAGALAALPAGLLM